MKIYDLIPDANVLTQLAPEELAYQLLRVAHSNLQNGIVNRQTIINVEPQVGQQSVYAQQQLGMVEVSLIEGLHWLEVNGLILPAAGINGNNGFRILGLRGIVWVDLPG